MSLFFPGEADECPKLYDHDEHGQVVEGRQSLFSSLWYAFIVPKHYSSRKLTEASDKLVAVSGLASKLKSYQSSVRYLAGLWSGLVLEELL